MTAELLVISLLLCGVMLLNTSNTQIAAWPQLLFWSTAFTLGCGVCEILVLVSQNSCNILVSFAAVFQTTVFFYFSSIIVYLVLSVSIFLLTDEEQKWLHGVLYEPGYIYGENIWITQLKFICFVIIGAFGVLMAMIICWILQNVVTEQANKNFDKLIQADRILNVQQQNVAWGRHLRLHFLQVVLFGDCLSRYLIRVCNDAETSTGDKINSDKLHCFFSPFDIPPNADSSSQSSQSMEYGAFVLLNLMCDVVVQKRLSIITTKKTATGIDGAATQVASKRRNALGFVSFSTRKSGADVSLFRKHFVQNKRDLYVIMGTRAVQFAVFLIVFLAYVEQRFAFITEFLTILLALLVLVTIYTDFRDINAQETNIATKTDTSARKLNLQDIHESHFDDGTSTTGSNAVSFRYDVIDPAHVPGPVYIRPRLGLKSE